jgi:hypothetical protein
MMREIIMKTWNELAEYLKRRSNEICADNGCTDDEHHCESYAYISKDGLLDICASDYFQGSSKPHAAISLPWIGTGDELKEEVYDQCADMEAGPGSI